MLRRRTRLHDVQSSRIESFKIGSSETRFGPFTFVGGLQMTSSDRNFGSLSGWRFRDAGVEALSVSDNGFWVSGRIERDASSIPSGFTNVRMPKCVMRVAHRHRKSGIRMRKSLSVDGDKVTVGFERRHRIATGTMDMNSLVFQSQDERLPIRRGS